ncbi:pyridoxine 5'-phosphate synthase [Phycisphaera mikurensis]|uniref:Pyridoxine 5'-phosphate synthase n=1 Tax=Phycisphaera mikurensis (strain NBRC 102666 / KCTC 22515 / FYK2301M01) TaxID=1142394 RepID=I0IFY9_PHYMF|nr:pyridoxine 5'-phosphate synthase [Phycisphaera mikurensis]MBB6440437.1 pyridoxine 5-phosphate synthase [Phycisphaera mikurensis]BAM04177.1 pyridoxine 5'-phosphate synthase [Phycisphaera mikurensis NBRC 102666]
MPTALSVNINKIALLRNARPGNVPDPVGFGRLALEAGAQGLTVHPRPDERHIRRGDVERTAALLAEPAWAAAELNVEGNPLLPHFLPIVRGVRPDQVTLVPDGPDQNTSDHGFDGRDAEQAPRLRDLTAELKALGCRVSLFVDADEAAMEPAARLGVDRVELYTGPWAEAFGTGSEAASLGRFQRAAAAAADAGLGVNAGHDLSLANLGRFLSIGGIEEVSIGHALCAEALEHGVAETVRRYLRLCSGR